MPLAQGDHGERHVRIRELLLVGLAESRSAFELLDDVSPSHRNTSMILVDEPVAAHFGKVRIDPSLGQIDDRSREVLFTLPAPALPATNGRCRTEADDTKPTVVGPT